MKRVLTGIRPTGQLHLGHYVGALEQWIPLQTGYKCFFLIADVQALTTHAHNPDLVKHSTIEVVRDWLAVGLKPAENVHFVLQSAVTELYELTVLLSLITPQAWMDANPTVREERQRIADASVGFGMYPVAQAADIVMVSDMASDDPILVPVGEDQAPHLRDTNRIAQRFNRQYGRVLSLCEALIGEVGRLPGTDGKMKMSKSADNAIFLADSPTTVAHKVRKMYTDPTRLRATDPGHVEGNPVFDYLKIFCTDTDLLADLEARYTQGQVGDVEVKRILIEHLERFLHPIRERRLATPSDADLMEMLMEGTAAARVIAHEVLANAREAMGLPNPLTFA